MNDLIFYILSMLTLIFGVLVVANPFSKNPVTSAMFLVMHIVSVAGLFVMLHAFFLAAVQILVYAGAVIVLFLFVIMLLDIRHEERRLWQFFGITTGGIVLFSIAFILVKAIVSSGIGEGKSPAFEGSTAHLGKVLFTEYVLPFEMMGVLLLVAMIGVIVLSKKKLD